MDEGDPEGVVVDYPVFCEAWRDISEWNYLLDERDMRNGFDKIINRAFVPVARKAGEGEPPFSVK